MTTTMEAHYSGMSISDQKVSFCKEIREFIADSRKSQTLYANTDGYYKRTVTLDDMTLLDSYIYTTLSGNFRDSSYLRQSNTDKDVHNIMKKICETNRRCRTGNEIHFYVVWLYFFDYDTTAMKSTPLFKIFKNTSDSDAFYIDTSLVVYDSWDVLMDKGQFPNAFICAPRGGQYNFRQVDGKDVLDLEFLCRSTYVKNCVIKWSTPFSQAVILPMFHQSWVKWLTGGCNAVSTAATFLMSLGPKVAPYSLVVVGVCGIISLALKIWDWKQSGNPLSSIRSIISNSSFMLLNTTEEKAHSRLLSVAQSCKEGSSKFGMVDGMVGIVDEDSFGHFLKLIKEPKKNAWEILHFILRAIPKFCKTIVLALISSGYEQSVWIPIVELIGLIARFLEEPQNKVENLKLISEEALKCLSCLQRNSLKSVEQDLQKLPKGLPKKSSLELIPSNIAGSFVVNNFLGYRVYCLPLQRADCENFLSKLLNSKYTLKSLDLYFYSIIQYEQTVGFAVFWRSTSVIVISTNAVRAEYK